MLRPCNFRLWVCGLVMALMLLPPELSAQDYKFTTAGRVKHGNHFRMLNIMPQTRGGDWNTSGRGHKYWYPQDEWNGGTVSGWFPSGMIEQIILNMEGGSVTNNQWYGLFNGWSGANNKPNQWFEFNTYGRHRLPKVYVGIDETDISSTPLDVVDPNLPSDQMLVNHFTYKNGYQFKSSHYAFENAELDRSLIHHWQMVYDGVKSRAAGATNDSITYIFPGQILTFWHGHHWAIQNGRANSLWGNTNTWGNNRQDDYADLMEAPSRILTAADAARAANLQIAFTKDGYSTRLTDFDGSYFDDTGDPLIGPQFAETTAGETGELMTDKIFGSAYFHWSQSGTDNTDRFSLTDQSQNAPHAFFVTRTRGSYWGGFSDYGTAGRKALYNTPAYMRSDMRVHFDNAGANTSGIQWTNMSEAAIASIPGWKPEHEQQGCLWSHLICGPLDFEPGTTHDRIFTFAVGDYPKLEAVEYGRRYLKWLGEQKAGVHPKADELKADVVPMTDTEKWQVLEAVKDTLFTIIDKSFTAWHGGPNSGLSTAQKIAGDGLRMMPLAPPAPDILVKGAIRSTEVYAWYPDDNMFLDGRTGVDDFAGWRIYRKEGRPDVGEPGELESFGNLVWELVGEVSGAQLGSDHYNAEHTFLSGVTRRVMKFTDTATLGGKQYYYAVTAYDNGTQNNASFIPGPVEGSRMLAASGMFGGGVAVSAFSPGMSHADSIRVVPNPWTRDGGSSSLTPGINANQIRFVRLPGICTLKIFNEAGDLVQTIEHNESPYDDDETWFQQTSSYQIVKTGVYILAVLNGKTVDPVTKDITGDVPDTFVKFVIIR